MFAPQSVSSIEISAHYYRRENEAWAANERLARLARSSSTEPSLFSRALERLVALLHRERPASAPAPDTTTPPSIDLARPRIVSIDRTAWVNLDEAQPEDEIQQRAA